MGFRRPTVTLLLTLLLLSVAGHHALAQPRVSFGGHDLFLSGSNVAWVNFARDLGPDPLDTTAFKAAFDSIHAHGGNAMRLWLHTTCENSPQFDGTYKVIGPGPYAIGNLKTILDLAWQRKIGLVLCLWSFDMMDSRRASYATERARLMLTDSSYTRAYLNNSLIPMASAVKGHPAIIAWEVFNEAEGMSNEFGWSGIYHVPMWCLQTFVNRVAGALHRVDSTAKVTTGAWALTSQCDVAPVAKTIDLETKLSTMSAQQKEELEATFTARYGFTVPAREILSKFTAVQNYNYYRDDRLVAVGGDPDGTLDFYTVHYYDWQGTSISPFHHPSTTWNLTKPLIIAEFFPEQTLGIPYTNLYQLLFSNGYAGALSWGWYSGASGHSQTTLQTNTMALTEDLFSCFPDAIDCDPVSGTIYGFKTSRALLDAGEGSTLSWKTAVGSTPTLNGQPVAIRDTISVFPNSTTTYTLVTQGTTPDTATVTVQVYESGRIIAFSASATTVAQGDPVMLRWHASHESQVQLNGSPVNRIDSLLVHPDSTIVYVLSTTGTTTDTARIMMVVQPVNELNRALSAAVSVSYNPASYDPRWMVDGDTTTAWQSYGGDYQWAIFDLGAFYNIKRVKIMWGTNYAVNYGLKFSTDRSVWQLAFNTAAGAGGTEVVDSLEGVCRYLLLSLDVRSSSSGGFVVRELGAYGTLQGSQAAEPGSSQIPEHYALFQNYPNPFNPTTTFRIALPERSHVTLVIYNVIGQEVARMIDGDLEAGYQVVSWRPELASGLYFCRLTAQATGSAGRMYQQTIKLMLLK